MSALEGLLGFGITAFAMLDVFTSVLVPGPVLGRRNVGATLRRLSMPFWRFLTRSGGRVGSTANLYAPLLFLVVFLSWLLLLLLGFALMVHAVATAFHPALPDFPTALYVAGCSILTVGVSEFDATGLARCLVLAAALCGFSVITTTITFILQIQTSVQQRESGVLTLTGLAGRPQSAIVLLETFGQLGLRSELPAFFQFWRDWSASLLHSHMASPLLGFFHSVDAETDWLTSLLVVLDAAAIVSTMPDEPAGGMATLMHRMGCRAVSRLADMYGIPPQPERALGPEVLVGLATRLAQAGFPVSGPDALRELSDKRAGYAGRLLAMAIHFGIELPRPLPP